jgi:YgiT-type zinc finger domain-containing protein
MICLLCRQTEIIDGYTSVNFERGEMHLVITQVPARVCQSCGEAYVDETTASQLLRIAKDTAKAGVLEEEIQYPDSI